MSTGGRAYPVLVVSDSMGYRCPGEAVRRSQRRPPQPPAEGAEAHPPPLPLHSGPAV